MADKVTQVKELKLVAKFVDNDTRTLTIPDPKADLTAAQINAVGILAASGQVLIGDKGGADFHSFITAKTSMKRTTVLDLR